MNRDIIIGDLTLEMKNALNSLSGFTELLDKQLCEPAHVELLAYLKSSVVVLLRQVKMLDDLMYDNDFLYHDKSVKINLRDLLVNALRFVKTLKRKRNIFFDFEFDENIPEIMFGNSIHFGEMFDNLLEGVLVLSQKDSVKFCVKIAEKDVKSGVLNISFEVFFESNNLKNIFDMSHLKNYLREFTSLQKNIAGAILGMAVAIELIERCGENMVFENLGKDTFRLAFNFKFLAHLDTCKKQ